MLRCFARGAAYAKAALISNGLARRSVQLDELNVEAMHQERRNASDGATLALAFVEREVALCGSVELNDPRDAKPSLKRLPDIGGEAIATGQVQMMLTFPLRRRGIEEIAA